MEYKLDKVIKDIVTCSVTNEDVEKILLALIDVDWTGLLKRKADEIKDKRIRERERERVRANNTRAQIKGLPATLTFDEWWNILEVYGWCCAYCSKSLREEGVTLDHFFSVRWGRRGTTRDNCVPCCAGCNKAKGIKQVKEILLQMKLTDLPDSIPELNNPVSAKVLDVYLNLMAQSADGAWITDKRELEIYYYVCEKLQRLPVVKV